jgi:glutathione peroxidase
MSISRSCLALLAFCTAGVVPPASASACPSLLDHTFPGLLDGKPVPLCQYAGKVILVVNTASYCGFTSQYDGLEKLYERLKDKGLVVLGFPSNDFGEQEPGSEKEIADFCRLTYGVQFPMMGKTTVRGRDANPFYVKLAEVTGSRPKWNFHKYLINRDGSKVVAYSSFTKPDDRDLLKKIDEFLAR